MTRARLFWFFYRLCAAGVAFGTGVALYLWSAICDGCFDEPLALFFQPLMAVVFSGVIVGLSLMVGGLLSLNRRLLTLWRRLLPLVAGLVVVSGLSVVVLAVAATLSRPVDEGAGLREVTFSGYILLFAYPVVLFCIACFPAPFSPTKDSGV